MLAIILTICFAKVLHKEEKALLDRRTLKKNWEWSLTLRKMWNYCPTKGELNKFIDVFYRLLICALRCASSCGALIC